MGSISWRSTDTARVEFARHIDSIVTTNGLNCLHRSIQPTGTARLTSDRWSLVGYAAMEGTTGEVWAYVGLAAKSQGEFYVKDMEESMGPDWYDNVPVRLLNSLTPTTHQWANEWRANARGYHETARRQRSRAAELVGQTVQLERALNYGGRVGTVTSVEVVSANLWRDPTTGLPLRPPKLWAGDTLITA